MTAFSPEDEIRQLREDLERERDRADRAQIEAHIAWEMLALMRELVVKHRLNITMLQGYEPIKALEGYRLHQEVERRFKDKREREAATARALEEETNDEPFEAPPHRGPEDLDEMTMMETDEGTTEEEV